MRRIPCKLLLAFAALLFADSIFATERGVQRVEIPLTPKDAAIRAVNLLRDFQPLIYFSISKVWAVWSGKVGLIEVGCVVVSYGGLLFGLLLLTIGFWIVGYLFMINEIPQRLFRLLSKVISDQSRTVGK